jgi:hypothetical protein
MQFDFANFIGFEWDKGNLNKNRLKHGDDVKECEEVFFNEPLVVLFDTRHSKLEKRYNVYGITDSGRKLALAITFRKDKIRVIMARDQSRKERGALGGDRQ